MKLKSFIKRRMLKRKNIILDCMSSINYNVIHTNSERACIVNDSNIHISSFRKDDSATGIGGSSSYVLNFEDRQGNTHRELTV